MLTAPVGAQNNEVFLFRGSHKCPAPPDFIHTRVNTQYNVKQGRSRTTGERIRPAAAAGVAGVFKSLLSTREPDFEHFWGGRARLEELTPDGGTAA